MTTEQTASLEEEPKRLDAFFWAGALIWMGLVFGADSLGLLPQIGTANPWSWIFLGGGVCGLVLSFISMSSPNFANPTAWDWGWSIVFLLIGASGFIAINIPGWLVLIVIGAAILVSAFRPRE